MPIVKRREGKEVKEYRRVTIMPTLYRVYMTTQKELRRTWKKKGNFEESGKV